MRYCIYFVSIVYRALLYCKRRASLASAVRQGLVLGNGTKIVGDVVFGSEPYLISVGASCLITDGVRFITHDGGIQVPFIKNGHAMSEIYGRKVLAGSIGIGSNVFVGCGSILLPGTLIGNNVLVGAGSVLRGNYPSDSVIAGVPAKVICSIDDYYKKNCCKLVDVDSREFSVRKNIFLDKVVRSAQDDV